jgi:hypothetical protein
MMHTLNSNPKGFGQISTLYGCTWAADRRLGHPGSQAVSNNRNVALEINQAGVSFVSSLSELSSRYSTRNAQYALTRISVYKER